MKFSQEQGGLALDLTPVIKELHSMLLLCRLPAGSSLAHTKLLILPTCMQAETNGSLWRATVGPGRSY